MSPTLIWQFLAFLLAIPSVTRSEDGIEGLIERVLPLTEQSSDLVILSSPNGHGVPHSFKKGHSSIATTLLTLPEKPASTGALLTMMKMWKSPLVALLGMGVEDVKVNTNLLLLYNGIVCLLCLCYSPYRSCLMHFQCQDVEVPDLSCCHPHRLHMMLLWRTWALMSRSITCSKMVQVRTLEPRN